MLTVQRTLRISAFFMYLVASNGQGANEGNWSQPHRDFPDYTKLTSAERAKIAANGIEFTFELPSFALRTSAAVYDSAGEMVKILWMNRSYEVGPHTEAWDGTTSSGNKAKADRYVVRVAANNVDYQWDGIIGNTESSWSSVNTWDGTLSSLIRSVAFLGGKGYTANGYSEGAYASSVFREDAPNSEVFPLTKLIFNASKHFMFASTDGKLLYFGFQSYVKGLQGVAAFHPDGEYYPFPQGSAYPSKPFDDEALKTIAKIPPIGISDARVADLTHYPQSAITGLAVQRNGPILATAHGFYKPGYSGSPQAASSDMLRLWDKTTGRQVGEVRIPNPQILAFDLNNVLWAISGDGGKDVLYEIRDVGRTNIVVVSPLKFSNPVSISVSPLTGSLFITDGGENQQVFEVNPQTKKVVSTVGIRGGYLASGSCDSSVSNSKFWFDPGPEIRQMPVVGISSPFVSWAVPDENGGLWIADFSTDRVLHFKKINGRWEYVDRIMYMPWGYSDSVLAGDPTRLFGGPTGFLEFKVDYAVPLIPGDPAKSPRAAWELRRNWLPCFLAAEHTGSLESSMRGFSVGSDQAFGAVFSTATYNVARLLRLEQNNTLKIKRLDPALSGWTAFDDSGSYYRVFIDGKPPAEVVSIRRYSVAGFDRAGFPEWFSIGTPLASYAADRQIGDPIPLEQRWTLWPSVNGVIPILGKDAYGDGVAEAFRYHLAGLRLGGAKLIWRSLPEKKIPFTDGEGSFPAADVRGKAEMGVNAWAMDDNIFVFQNGNGGPYSCQFYHFKDDGLFVGQFGFQTSAGYPPTYIGWGTTGYPQKGTELPLAPGECADAYQVNAIKHGDSYYIYLGDEGYFKGIHRWHISQLASYREYEETGNLGSRLTLH